MQFRFQRLFAPSVHLRSCRATLIHGLSCSSWTSTNNAALNLNLRLWQLWQDVKKMWCPRCLGVWKYGEICQSRLRIIQGDQDVLRSQSQPQLWCKALNSECLAVVTSGRRSTAQWICTGQLLSCIVGSRYEIVWHNKKGLCSPISLSLSVPLPPSLYLPISLSRSLLSLSL